MATIAPELPVKLIKPPTPPASAFIKPPRPKHSATTTFSGNTQTGGTGNAQVGTLTQGPGSIAQIGGTGNQASITNIGIEPPLPNVTWTLKAMPSGESKNPAVELEMRVDRPLSNPTFRAVCDRPCQSESGSIHVPGAMFQTQRGWDETNPNVAILHFNIPSIITPDTPVGWVLRSQDNQQIQVLEIKAIRIP